MESLLLLLNDYFFLAYISAIILLIILLGLVIRGRILLERRTRIYIGKLKASEERYRLLADNARDVIWVFDLKLGYIYVSPSIMQLRGFTVEEALKQRIEDILTPESYGKMKGLLDRAKSLERQGLENDTEWSFTSDMELVRKDGSTVWTEITMNILYDETGKAKGFMGITRDISERKKAEEEAKRREKLQGVLEMAGAVCHELNQPLQVLMSSIDLLLAEAKTGEHERELLDSVHAAVEEIGTLTGRIMRITGYEVKDYMGGKGRIIDITRSSSGDGGKDE